MAAALRRAACDRRAVLSTYRADSQVSRLDRGELRSSDAHPLVADAVASCASRPRARTDGAFDAWLPGDAGGCAFDPSGLVKGWAVERAAALLADLPGVSACMQRRGGDIAVVARRGPPRRGADAITWRIGIEDPRDLTRSAEVVTVTRGAVATSGTAARGAHALRPGRAGGWSAGRAPLTVHGPGTCSGPTSGRPRCSSSGAAGAPRRVHVACAGVRQHRAAAERVHATEMTPRRHPLAGGVPFVGGAEGTRTPDPLHAMQVRYQLRHSPNVISPLLCLDNSRNTSQRARAGREIGVPAVAAISFVGVQSVDARDLASIPQPPLRGAPAGPSTDQLRRASREVRAPRTSGPPPCATNDVAVVAAMRRAADVHDPRPSGGRRARDRTCRRSSPPGDELAVAGEQRGELLGTRATSSSSA